MTASSTVSSPDLMDSYSLLYSSTVNFSRDQVSVGRPTASSAAPRLVATPPISANVSSKTLAMAHWVAALRPYMAEVTTVSDSGDWSTSTPTT